MIMKQTKEFNLNIKTIGKNYSNQVQRVRKRACLTTMEVLGKYSIFKPATYN